MPTNFENKVYHLTSQIPEGKVTTYQTIAHALHTHAYQAVGQALKKNPFAPQVPCHRVIKSNGRLGGFAGQTKVKKIKEKQLLLEKEGVLFKNGQIENLKNYLFTFSSSAKNIK